MPSILIGSSTGVAKDSKRSKAGPSKISLKPLISVKAEPLSEDDFEEDAKADVQQYAQIQHNANERKRIQAENIRRKENGIKDLLQVPSDLSKKLKRAKYKGRRSGGDEDDDGEDRGSFLAGSGDSDTWATKSGKRSGKGPKRIDEEKFNYEGQVVLNFNPLYKLAGIPDPGYILASREELRQEFLAQVEGGQGSSNTPSNLSAHMTIHNGILMKKSDVPIDVSTESHVSEEEEEAPEEVYYDDDLTVPVSEIAEEEVEAEEEVYEDELVAETQEPETIPVKESLFITEDLVPDDLPPYRPAFSFTEEQSQIGPLILQGPTGDMAVHKYINRFLREYQRKGAQFFYDKYSEGRGGVLGDDMGLGKTIQVIAFLSAIMRKTGTAAADYNRRKKLIRSRGEFITPKHWPTALIVCPNSLVRNWERELDTWGYFEFEVLRTADLGSQKQTFLNGWLDLLIVPYETARNVIEQIKGMPYSVVIADEAHRLKTPNAALTLAMKKIVCSSCFGLTGTLIQNRIDEIWSVLDFVDRGWAGTVSQWKAFAVNPIKKGQQHEGTTFDVVMSIKRLGVMQAKILPYFSIRRDKRLIANELPAKNDRILFCRLTDRQSVACQNLIESDEVQFILRKDDPCDCGSDEKRSKCCHTKTPDGQEMRDVIFTNMTAYKKVSNHFGLLYHAKDDSDQTRKVNEKIFKTCTGIDYINRPYGVVEAALDPENCGKWRILSGLLQEWRRDRAADNKVLIFSSSVRLLKMIAEFISTSSELSGFEFDSLTGEVGAHERMEMVDRFQDSQSDHFVLLISTLAGGVGLNLTAANKVVIFDPSWNPADDLQAMDRAFRMGQKRVVDVYRLIGQGTIEENMYLRQVNKQQRAKQLNEGTMQARLHQGYDGAKTVEEQGELYGMRNIFRFNSDGFIKANIQRDMEARDRFVQDKIEAEYESDSDDEDDDEEDEAGRKMRHERKQLELNKARERYRIDRDDKETRRQRALVDDLLEEEGGSKSKRTDVDILETLQITPHMHEEALKESTEEREIYEIGLRLVKDFPDLAATIKANEIGKYKSKRPSAGRGIKADPGVDTLKRDRMEADSEGEPWKARFEKKARISTGKVTGPKMLAALSDDEE